jgi:CheY-like chemotaxis protein
MEDTNNQTPPQPRQEQASNSNTTSQNQKIRVGVALYHKAMREDFANYLKKFPNRYEVVGTATNEAEALALGQSEQPDLLILDRNRFNPKSGGIWVVNQLKAAGLLSSVKVLMATSDPTIESVTDILSCGATRILDKLSGYAEFLEVVESLFPNPDTPLPAPVKVAVYDPTLHFYHSLREIVESSPYYSACMEIVVESDEARDIVAICLKEKTTDVLLVIASNLTKDLAKISELVAKTKALNLARKVIVLLDASSSNNALEKKSGYP